MASRNVRVFEVDPSALLTGVYGRLLKAQGISGRAQVRVTRKLREAIKDVLVETVKRARLDGSMPYRTGRGYRNMLLGARAYGTSFRTLRGHVVGPEYMLAHENSAEIKPVKARAIAIPLPAALKADGSPKLPGPRSWKNVLNTFVYKSKRTGQAYIAYKNTQGSLTLLYSLVDSVQLSKHKGFMSTAWEKTSPQFLEAVGSAMLFEMSQVDLLDLMGVTYKGRRKPRRV